MSTDLYLWDETVDPRDIVLRTTAAAASTVLGGIQVPLIDRVRVRPEPHRVHRRTVTTVAISSQHGSAITAAHTDHLVVTTASAATVHAARSALVRIHAPHSHTARATAHNSVRISTTDRSEIRDNPDDLLALLLIAAT